MSYTNVSEKYKYTGKEKDITGLYYYGARYYDPEIGRFTTRDPKKGDIMNPQTFNPYVYCLNNPLKYIDPDGRECLKPLQEMYGFDSSATLDDYALFFGIVSLFFGGGEIYFVGKATIEGLAALGAGGASTIGGILSMRDSPYDVIKEWLKNSKYKGEDIDDLRYSSVDNPEFAYIHFPKNDIWLKLTLKRDFWGD